VARETPALLCLLLLIGCYGLVSPVANDDDAVEDDDDTTVEDDDDTTPRPDDDDATPPIDDDDAGPDDDDTTPPADDDDVMPDDDDATPPPGPYCYSETVSSTASLADLVSGYSSWDWEDTVFEVTARRYPSGNLLLTQTQADPWFGAFVDPSSFNSLMDSLGTMLHEQTHYWDYDHALFEVYFGYFVNEDWQPQPNFFDGFPRSEILSMLPDDSTAMYADTYLTGDQGTYGFMELLDELNCYINGLAGLSLVGEYMPWGTSARDGAVAFMLYLELYLQRARTVYPSLHAQICGDPELTDLMLVQWLRMHWFLDISEAFPELGIYDDAIEVHLYAPGNQSEIELCTGHPLQASPCLTEGDSWLPPW